MGEVGLDGGGEVVEGTAALLAAGFDDGQHRFQETAAAGALRSEGELAPDDGVTQRAFARVVRRLDTFLADERPEPGPWARAIPDTCRPAICCRFGHRAAAIAPPRGGPEPCDERMPPD